MNTEERKFCKLLDAYFDALIRGGTQTQIDEARLAIIAEYNRTRNEADDLRGFIDGIKPHVLAAAAMYGASVRVDAVPNSRTERSKDSTTDAEASDVDAATHARDR